MIKTIAHDGDIYNNETLADYKLDSLKDISLVQRVDTITGEDLDEYDRRICFVGFVCDSNDDLFVSFPKNFKVDNETEDAQLLFKVIARYAHKHRSFIGMRRKNEPDIESNFPFSAAANIYDYYSRFGLYFSEQEILNKNSGKRINWKETIRLANKFPTPPGRIVLFPFYYGKRVTVPTFLTLCMVFAINYTAEKFGSILAINKIPYETPRIDIMRQSSPIIRELSRIRKQTFKDSLLNLIDSLTVFFLRITSAGRYHLKLHNFEAVWEEMVRNHLSKHFDGMSGDAIKLVECPSTKIVFSKPSFHPNLARPNQFFAPDCYASTGCVQFIFDAKYYTSPHGLMYKELVYAMFLRDHRTAATEPPLYTSTICSIILPSEIRKTENHFEMNPLFSDHFKNLRIKEEYFPIKEVLADYII